MTDLHYTQDSIDTEALDLGIQELDEMVDPGFWDTAAGVVVGTVVAGGIVYGAGFLVVAT